MANAAILKGKSSDELDAFVRLVALVAHADGELSQEEMEVLERALSEACHERIEGARLRALLEAPAPVSTSVNNPWAHRVTELKALLPDPETHRQALVLAVEVARADRRIGFRESSVLANIIGELGIDLDFAQSLMVNS